MSTMTADKCNRCGKVVVKHNHADSSDMVQTCDSFLYMCDLKPKESSRPNLSLREYGGEADDYHYYCLDCLLEKVREWVAKMKQRGASKIPLSHIVFPDGKGSPPCPCCGR